MNNTTDTFEAIALDAVTVITAVSLMLQNMGLNDLADELADEATDFCDRAIALGGE